MFLPFDPIYLLYVAPAFILAIWAQARVASSFRNGSKVRLARGLRGAEVARIILDSSSLGNVRIEEIPGALTDHYDPRAKVLRLSSPVFGGVNAASAGVAAHEAGHALQHAAGYLPVVVRNGILPLAIAGSQLAVPLFVIGLVFTGLSYLMTVAIVLFAGVVAFQVVTLPVEVNASRRALRVLSESGILVTSEEIGAAKGVLTAAALTYLAGMLQALLTLAYFVMRSRR